MADRELAGSAANTSTVSSLKLGSVLNNRFEIVRSVPSKNGNIFVVRRLTAPRQGEMAMLKLLSQNFLGEDQRTITTRFQHEIVAALSVKHPNVTRIEEPIKHGRLFGYVYEYVEGKTLAEILKQQKLSVAKVTIYLAQLCNGLSAIHKAGIVHRGLKPQNILVTASDHLKILNFALAKLADQKGLTQAGAVLGTPDYIAPEYVTEGSVDKRIDIYAVGVIAYEMVCGEIPFLKDDLVEMFSNRATQEPIPPNQINSLCPAALSEIIVNALRPDKNARYQSIDDMRQDLERMPGASKMLLPKAPSTSQASLRTFTGIRKRTPQVQTKVGVQSPAQLRRRRKNK